MQHPNTTPALTQTLGLDIGDRESAYCVLGPDGGVLAPAGRGVRSNGPGWMAETRAGFGSTPSKATRLAAARAVPARVAVSPRCFKAGKPHSMVRRCRGSRASTSYAHQVESSVSGEDQWPTAT